jgi:hypothetical protein
MKDVVYGLILPRIPEQDKKFTSSLDGARESLSKENVFVEFVRAPLEFHDFVLARTRGGDRITPDLSYGIGYARGAAKEVVLIAPDAISRKALGIGASECILCQSDKQNALEKAIKVVASRVRARQKNERSIPLFGGRDQADMPRAFKLASHHVHILATNLKWFAEGDRIRGLKTCLQLRDVTVRILTLDPQSVFVAYRAKQLGLEVSRFRDEMVQGLDLMQKALSQYAKRRHVEIRTYDDFPTQVTVAVDSNIFVCTVARASRSRSLCIFKVESDAPSVERSFVFHFDTLWTIGTPYQHSYDGSQR